jgi:hypothetical protein
VEPAEMNLKGICRMMKFIGNNDFASESLTHLVVGFEAGSR